MLLKFIYLYVSNKKIIQIKKLITPKILPVWLISLLYPSIQKKNNNNKQIHKPTYKNKTLGIQHSIISFTRKAQILLLHNYKLESSSLIHNFHISSSNYQPVKLCSWIYIHSKSLEFKSCLPWLTHFHCRVENRFSDTGHGGFGTRRRQYLRCGLLMLKWDKRLYIRSSRVLWSQHTSIQEWRLLW